MADQPASDPPDKFDPRSLPAPGTPLTEAEAERLRNDPNTIAITFPPHVKTIADVQRWYAEEPGRKERVFNEARAKKGLPPLRLVTPPPGRH